MKADKYLIKKAKKVNSFLINKNKMKLLFSCIPEQLFPIATIMKLFNLDAKEIDKILDSLVLEGFLQVDISIVNGKEIKNLIIKAKKRKNLIG